MFFDTKVRKRRRSELTRDYVVFITINGEDKKVTIRAVDRHKARVLAKRKYPDAIILKIL